MSPKEDASNSNASSAMKNQLNREMMLKMIDNRQHRRRPSQDMTDIRNRISTMNVGEAQQQVVKDALYNYLPPKRNIHQTP
jgi:hypothetical protein